MCCCSFKADHSQWCRKIWKKHTVQCYKADTLPTTMGVSLTVCVPFSHGGTVSRVHIEESWQWTYSYPTNSWPMTHSSTLTSVSFGAERPLKGFSKWWSHAWGCGVQDRASAMRQDGLSAVECFCSANPKLHLHTVIYCQGQGSLLARLLISW